MMPNVAQTVANNPLKMTLAIIPVLIGVIYFAVDVRSWIVTTDDLNLVKEEIIDEMRDESAKLRTAYLRDLESRLEDVEVDMETAEESDVTVSKATRRKAKRLQKRIDEITKGT